MSSMSSCWLRYDCTGVQFILPIPDLADTDLCERIIKFAEGRSGIRGAGIPVALEGGAGVGVVYKMKLRKTCNCAPDACRLQVSVPRT